MKKLVKLFALFLVLVLCTSCKGQKKTESLKEKGTESNIPSVEHPKLIKTIGNQRDLQGNREARFWLGTIAYVIVGFVFLLMYSFPIPD